MKAYKGFDKDLKCRGFQFEIGKEYEEDSAELCEFGFHACEHPLDCLSYYPPADSRYCEVDIDDNGQRREIDTKVCGKKIKIGVEIGIKGLIHAAFEYTKAHCKNEKMGEDRSAITGGYRSAITGGDRSAITGGVSSAITGGYRSAITGGDSSAITGGDSSAIKGGDRSAITGGNCSAITGGDWSAITGGDWSAITGGYRSAITGGDWSVVYGGEGAKVRAGKGSVLALQFWKGHEFVGIKFKEVDGVNIKADTYYRLDKAGKFIEVKDDTV